MIEFIFGCLFMSVVWALTLGWLALAEQEARELRWQEKMVRADILAEERRERERQLAVQPKLPPLNKVVRV